MPLRSYQLEGVDALWEFFEQNRKGHPLLAYPTGTGKSLILAACIHRAVYEYPETCIWALTHVKKLIEQNFAKLLQRWPNAPAGVYSSGLGRKDTQHQIIFGGIQSIVNVLEQLPVPNIVFIDEAHLVGPNDNTRYGKVFAYLLERNPRVRFVGLSATCYRMGHGMLTNGKPFTHMAIDYTSMERFNELVHDGFIAPLSAKKTAVQLDVSGVKTSGDDYNQKQLQEAVDKDGITRRALSEAIEWGRNRKRWLVFASGINHAEHIVDILAEYGYTAVTVHSDNHNAVNDANLLAFERGDVRIAVSMNALTTGVDVPEIDFIVMLRPTRSVPLWVQMLGRGTRVVYADGYDVETRDGRFAAMAASCKPNGCLVADFTSNTRELGPINNPVIPTERKRGQKAGARPAVVKACPACAEYVPPSVRFCYKCGHEFVIAVRIQDHSEGLEVMQVEAPRVEMFDIENVAYGVLRRAGRTPIFRAVYTARNKNGLRAFTEWLGFESEKHSVRRHASNWWIERSGIINNVPSSCSEAESQIKTLRIPKRARVWVNKARPEIMSYEY